MTYKISVYGRGNEFAIGTIKDDTWDYIQNTFDGSEPDYLDALDNGDVPDEHQLASASYEMYDCDDLYHHDGCWSDNYAILVEDEDGNTVFKTNNDDIKGSGVQVETKYESIDDKVSHICVWSSMARGQYLEGEFDVDGEFDPKKLKVIYQRVCYNHDDCCDEVVSSLEYDGEEINAECGVTDGKGDTTSFIEIEVHDDDEDDWE